MFQASAIKPDLWFLGLTLKDSRVSLFYSEKRLKNIFLFLFFLGQADTFYPKRNAAQKF